MLQLELKTITEPRCYGSKEKGVHQPPGNPATLQVVFNLKQPPKTLSDEYAKNGTPLCFQAAAHCESQQTKHRKANRLNPSVQFRPKNTNSRCDHTSCRRFFR